MMCALAPQTPAENVAHLPLRLLSCTLVESIRHTIADFAPIAGLQRSDQHRKQAAKDFERTQSIGIRQRRLRYGAATEMIKLAGVALQVGFNLTQAPRPRELCVQHRDQMSPGLDAARIAVGSVLLYKPIALRPWNVLQKVMKNDILMSHGVDPFSCPDDSQPAGIE